MISGSGVNKCNKQYFTFSHLKFALLTSSLITVTMYTYEVVVFHITVQKIQIGTRTNFILLNQRTNYSIKKEVACYKVSHMAGLDAVFYFCVLYCFLFS